MTEEMIISQTKLFVGWLNWKMRGNDLKTEFSKYGEVVFARVNLDRETKKSKGFGFVEFQNPADAAKAKEDPARLAARAEYNSTRSNDEDEEVEF